MEAGPGHNNPPLEDRIFTDPEVTPAAVLQAVAARLKRERTHAIAEISDRTRTLAGNGKRLPEKLTPETARTALDLLSAIDMQNDRAADERDNVLAAAKAVSDELTALCKPLDAGLAAVEKSLRPLLTEYLVERLDAHNAERTDGEERMSSFTERGPSGAKATVTDGSENAIVDPSAVPREFCVPDQKLIDKAMKTLKQGQGISGVEIRRSPSLRVSR